MIIPKGKKVKTQNELKTHNDKYIKNCITKSKQPEQDNDVFLKRDQDLFLLNILFYYCKYDDTYKPDNLFYECFCCKNLVSRSALGHSLIAAHIKRFADIQAEIIIKLNIYGMEINNVNDDKENLISPYNGFIFCVWHDWLFEIGAIYFDTNFKDKNDGPFLVNETFF